MDILYELYDVFPAGKGSSRRTRELLKRKNHTVDINFTLVCKYKSNNYKDKFSFEIIRLKNKYLDEKYNPIKDGLAYRKAFSEQLNLEKYQIIHSRSIWAGISLIKMRDKFNYKYIFECNGLPSIELPYTHPKFSKSNKKDIRKLAQNEIYCAMHADKIIVVTDVAKKYLTDRGILKDKIHIIPNAVNTDEFYPKMISDETKLGFFDNIIHPYSSDDIIIGYIGAMQPWQGIISLVRALPTLVKVYPNIKLVLAGKSKESWRKYLRTISKDDGVRDHLIIIKESKELKKLPDLINSFDIAIAPLENTPRNIIMGANPIKLYEYAACDKPIIVSDLPITREIFQRDDVYFIPTPENQKFIPSLIEAIKNGLKDPKISLKSVNNISWKRRTYALDKIYKKLLE